MFEVTPLQRAAGELKTAIERVARDVHGAQIVPVPIEGFERATRRTLDDPLAGVRAALLARDVAVAEMRAYAELARGAGRSWDDVAERSGSRRPRTAPRGVEVSEERLVLLVGLEGVLDRGQVLPTQSGGLPACGPVPR